MEYGSSFLRGIYSNVSKLKDSIRVPPIVVHSPVGSSPSQSNPSSPAPSRWLQAGKEAVAIIWPWEEHEQPSQRLDANQGWSSRSFMPRRNKMPTRTKSMPNLSVFRRRRREARKEAAKMRKMSAMVNSNVSFAPPRLQERAEQCQPQENASKLRISDTIEGITTTPVLTEIRDDFKELLSEEIEKHAEEVKRQERIKQHQEEMVGKGKGEFYFAFFGVSHLIALRKVI